VFDAERGRRIALRIQVDQEDLLAALGESGGDIHGGRGLAHAALLVGDGEKRAYWAGVQPLHGGGCRTPPRSVCRQPGFHVKPPSPRRASGRSRRDRRRRRGVGSLWACPSDRAARPPQAGGTSVERPRRANPGQTPPAERGALGDVTLAHDTPSRVSAGWRTRRRRHLDDRRRRIQNALTVRGRTADVALCDSVSEAAASSAAADALERQHRPPGRTRGSVPARRRGSGCTAPRGDHVRGHTTLKSSAARARPARPSARVPAAREKNSARRSSGFHKNSAVGRSSAHTRPGSPAPSRRR
jgi:hypothetical protein